MKKKENQRQETKKLIFNEIKLKGFETKSVIATVFLFYTLSNHDSEASHTITMKKLSIYSIFVIPFFFVMCSTNANMPDYPDWEGWKQAPPELSIEVIAPDSVSLSDSLEYTVKMTNRTNKKLSIVSGKSFSRNVEFDLAVVNEDQQVVWFRFPRDLVYSHVGYIVRLSPGESYIMQDSWNLKDSFGDTINPGSYTLYGGLNGPVISVLKDGKFVIQSDFGPGVTGSPGVEIQVVRE